MLKGFYDVLLLRTKVKVDEALIVPDTLVHLNVLQLKNTHSNRDGSISRCKLESIRKEIENHLQVPAFVTIDSSQHFEVIREFE